MTSVAERTNYPSIFGSTYWGGFKSAENPMITNQVINNRNAFARKYCLGQCCKDKIIFDIFITGLSSNSNNKSNAWDHIECYYIRTTPNARLVVTSPYRKDIRTQMEGYGFSIIDPIYSERTESFARLFCSKQELTAFGESLHMEYCDKCQLNNSKCYYQLEMPQVRAIPNHIVDPTYFGTIIYATPGSGKSKLGKLCHFLIDTDDLLLKEISEQYPLFEIDNTNHPGQVLLQFCRSYSRRDLDPIYETVGEIMKYLAHTRGETILTGSRPLMYLADHVFIQTNAAIVRQGFDQDIERETAIQLGKYIPIECYLKDILCYPFEQ